MQSVSVLNYVEDGRVTYNCGKDEETLVDSRVPGVCRHGAVCKFFHPKGHCDDQDKDFKLQAGQDCHEELRCVDDR
jgi:hypothetical protein